MCAEYVEQCLKHCVHLKIVAFCLYNFVSKEIECAKKKNELVKFLSKNQNRIKETNKFSFSTSDNTGIETQSL